MKYIENPSKRGEMGEKLTEFACFEIIPRSTARKV